MPPPEIKFNSPADIAETYRVNPRTIQRMCKAGAVPGAIRLGGQWRIPTHSGRLLSDRLADLLREIGDDHE